jgi:hypothetical protein
MGGDYYDRDVVSTTSSSGYSAQTDKVVGVNKSLHLSMNPQRWKDKKLSCDALNPIVFALDVTGSMGNWSKIIYEKMPMFYGQIMMQNYLSEPSISFCAIGDAKTDNAPLQVSEFGQGKEIDQLISKMFLEGKGGANQHESYELSAYFYDKYVELSNTQLPFYFVTGDEGFWDELEGKTIEKVIGSHIDEKIISGKQIWRNLMAKYNVFLIKKPYYNSTIEPQIRNQWLHAIAEERILMIETPKACIDVILGAIAITSGIRDLNGYINDMKDRGQTTERIEEVTKALNPYVVKLNKGEIKIVKGSASASSSSNIEQGIQSHYNIKEVTEKLILNDNLDEKLLDLFKNLRLLRSKAPEKVPKNLICPLTQEIFFEPYMTCDGHSYERKAIEEWLKNSDISPATNLKLQSKDLIPNLMVKKMVSELLNDNFNLI